MRTQERFLNCCLYFKRSTINNPVIQVPPSMAGQGVTLDPAGGSERRRPRRSCSEALAPSTDAPDHRANCDCLAEALGVVLIPRQWDTPPRTSMGDIEATLTPRAQLTLQVQSQRLHLRQARCGANTQTIPVQPPKDGEMQRGC